MMHKVFIAFIFLTSVLFARAEIDSKIKKTSTILNSCSKDYVNINKKMAKTAKEILRQKAKLMQQIEYLKKLQNELASKEKTYDENTKQLRELKNAQNILQEQKQKLEEELVFVIAQSVSLAVILEEEYPENEDSLIQVEVLKAKLKTSQEKAKNLGDKFFEYEVNIDLLATQASTLEQSIAVVDEKRKKLVATTEANKKALKKLERAKASYKTELQKLLKRQSTLKSTLEKLNLVKKDEIKKAKEEEERKRAFEQKNINLSENLPKVKKHGSSYQSMKTIKYRGKKTIAPLDSYTITKKYGTYRDPIYNIKIFNESISLKSKDPNAKVKNVLNGKVIYADNTAVLDNIVIVEHKNGLHTIYANLSQIAPNIKKGKKVRRGAVIGRIKDELVFEVTQKSYHINPIRLFK
jgi:septal ring factor EnvC (AmiA/AmiB activator)